jgi:hypothetical protein
MNELLKYKTKKVMLKKQKAVYDYIKDKHTQDECSGFIDGYERAENDFVKSSYYILALGIVIGGLIVGSFL